MPIGFSPSMRYAATSAVTDTHRDRVIDTHTCRTTTVILTHALRINQSHHVNAAAHNNNIIMLTISSMQSLTLDKK